MHSVTKKFMDSDEIESQLLNLARILQEICNLLKFHYALCRDELNSREN